MRSQAAVLPTRARRAVLDRPGPGVHAFDDRFSLRREFAKAKRVEADFARRLKAVARQCVEIIRAFDPTDPVQLAFLVHSLKAYSATLSPWARAVSQRMVAEVAARDKAAWIRVSARIGLNLRRELAAAPMDAVMDQLAEVQAALIMSIPTEASEQVARWTREGIAEGQRASTVADRIMSEIGGTTRSRAMLIARTEVNRTATTVMQARAEWVGSTHYRWMTAGDADVRPDHRVLDGRVFAWRDPPISDRRSGARAHPGQIYNCRCTALPIIDLEG